jgi:hypothetical protein
MLNSPLGCLPALFRDLESEGNIIIKDRGDEGEMAGKKSEEEKREGKRRGERDSDMQREEGGREFALHPPWQ